MPEESAQEERSQGQLAGIGILTISANDPCAATDTILSKVSEIVSIHGGGEIPNEATAIIANFMEAAIGEMNIHEPITGMYEVRTLP